MSAPTLKERIIRLVLDTDDEQLLRYFGRQLQKPEAFPQSIVEQIAQETDPVKRQAYIAEALKQSEAYFKAPFDPVGEDDWNAADLPPAQ